MELVFSRLILSLIGVIVTISDDSAWAPIFGRISNRVMVVMTDHTNKLVLITNSISYVLFVLKNLSLMHDLIQVLLLLFQLNIKSHFKKSAVKF